MMQEMTPLTSSKFLVAISKFLVESEKDSEEKERERDNREKYAYQVVLSFLGFLL
jgi:hypothetical protein